MRREIFNKVLTGAMVAAMAFTTLAPVTTYAAENDCPHNETHTVDIKTPTCTEDGIQNIVCELCGKVLEENVKAPAYGHDFYEATIKDGVIVERTCDRCGETIKFVPEKSISECTHNGSEETYNYDSEGCTTKGYTGDTVCTQCGKVLEPGKVIPAHGHDWELTESIKPTCTTDGKKVYTCADCEREKEDIIKATGHKWDNGEVTLAPTTTKEGTKKYKCETCGATRTETLAKLPDPTKPTEDNTTKPNDSQKDNTTKPNDSKKDNTTTTTKPATLAKKGTKLAVGGNTYVVTKIGKEVNFSKANSKAKAITVPSTIKVSGITYKVTSIGANAFKNCKKLKTVTIGTNVKTIKAKAFNKCPNLKKVTIKTTQLNKKTASKKSFSKVNKKMIIKVPKKVKKSYAKIFKGFKVK